MIASIHREPHAIKNQTLSSLCSGVNESEKSIEENSDDLAHGFQATLRVPQKSAVEIKDLRPNARA